jgi:hypothetical protein
LTPSTIPATPSRRPGRVRRGIVGTLLALLVLVLVWILAGIPLFVSPPAAQPGKADVIYVIGPPNPTRRDLAAKLVDEGFSDTVVFSVPADGPQSRAELAACNGEYPYPVTCDTPDPFTTQGEARYLKEKSEENGWDSAIVITWTPHVTRTQLIFSRCFTGDLMVVEDPVDFDMRQWISQYTYQSGAFLKALVTPGC